LDTLASLFPLDPGLLQRLLVERVLSSNAWLASCGREVIEEVAAAMAQRLPEALDQRLDGLIIAAFRAGQPVPAAPDPDVPELLLPPQRLQSSHQPRLQLQVGGRPMLDALFMVSVELELGELGLRLRDGQPAALRTGSASCSGILMLGSRMLARVNDKPLRLPAVLRLDQPPSERISP
jgi:hypothetical protein